MNSQKWLRPLRITVALVFILAFLLLFSDVRGKLPVSLYSFFTSFQFIPSLLKFPALPSVLSGLFIGIILLTLLSGRVYCSVFCPLGIVMDVLNRLFRWLPFLQRKRRFTKALNYLRYPILVALLISLFFTGLFAINLLDPYANYSRMATHLYQPVFVGVNNLLVQIFSSVGVYGLRVLEVNAFTSLGFFVSLSVLLLVASMVAFRDRLYCNSICPVGTVLGLLSRTSFFRVQIKEGSCTQCGKCQQVCKANCIDIKTMEVDASRCVACYNCIKSCSDEAIGYQKVVKAKVLSVSQEDKGKRNFLKAGLIALGAAPLIAHAKEGGGHGRGGHGSCFWSRGVASPPGSQSIDHLKDKCIACNLCIASCPTKVLQPAFMDYGFTGMLLPKMDFQKGLCNYNCTHCGDVCPTGAIFPLSVETKKVTQIGRVEFRKGRCVVKNEGTACGACAEHCPTQAVYMVPYRDGLTIPEVKTDICIGCGACEHACPVEDPHPAIFVAPHEVHQVALKPELMEKVEVEEADEEFPF